MTDEAHPLFGTWRITGMDLWDAGHIDLVAPGFIRFDAEGGGECGFGVVQATLDGHFSSHSIHFTWEGSDEMEPVCGDGDAEIEDDGTLSGEIRFHNGDETGFTARRMTP